MTSSNYLMVKRILLEVNVSALFGLLQYCVLTKLEELKDKNATQIYIYTKKNKTKKYKELKEIKTLKK